MYIKRVQINNYRGFKSLELSFDKGVNLIIGNNGTGKTSALDAVSIALAAVKRFLSSGFEARIEQSDVNTDIKRAGDSTYDIMFNYPVEIKGSFVNEEKEFDTNTVVNDGEHSIHLFGTVDRKDIVCEPNDVYPLICYQKFERSWKIPSNIRKGQVTLQTGLIAREEGYNGALSQSENIESIQQWCLRMSVMEYENKGTIQEFETFKNVISRFMKIIEESDKEFRLNYSMKLSGLVYEHDNVSIPIYELSTGYKALLTMIMELAYRAIILNPTISDDLKELTGTVLIDEIDAHLHPKWQWKVMDALTKTFPGVQFIVATHSPIVMSSAKNARIIVLDSNGEADYTDNAYGYTVDDVLRLRQSSDSMPKEPKELSEELDEAVENDDFKKAKEIVDKARLEFGCNSPIYQGLKQYYELNRVAEDIG